jgi:outer membrane phospholipase A
MKTTELKKLIKISVKEAFQEELKDIVVETLKSKNNSQPIQEQPSSSESSSLTKEEKMQRYNNILNETSLSFNSSDVPKQRFTPRPGQDSINGQLPEGNVEIDQIQNLMGKK